MDILIADDDPQTRHLLESMLTKWGYSVIVARDGNEAWDILNWQDPPFLAILDRKMPGLDGLTLCQRIRALHREEPIYILFLTGMTETEHIIEGLRGGADDYVTKPFFSEELQARLQVGVRMIQLQLTLQDRINALEEALAHIKRLQGLLPICSYCKRICDDQKFWQPIEVYITEHSDAEFSHGVCPECREKILKPEMEKLTRLRAKEPPDEE